MPDQQGRMPSTGSETLRPNAATFQPKLRATAATFVPSATAAAFVPSHQFQFSTQMPVPMIPVHQQYYRPVSEKPESANIYYSIPEIQNAHYPSVMQQINPISPRHQPKFHPNFHGQPAHSVSQTMSPRVDPGKSTRAPWNMDASEFSLSKEKRHISVETISDAVEPVHDRAEEALSADINEATPLEPVQAVMPKTAPIDAAVAADDVVAEVATPAICETDIPADHKAVQVPVRPDSDVSASNDGIEQPGPLEHVIAHKSAPPQEEAVCTSTGGDPIAAVSLPCAEGDIKPIQSTEESDSSDATHQRFTVEQILELQDQFDTVKTEANAVEITAAAKYSVDDLISFQDKFTSAPKFTSGMIDCIKGMTRSATIIRDSRSSSDRKGYQSSQQQSQRAPRQYNAAQSRSREASRTREFSRAQFGNLQGTVKTLDDGRDGRDGRDGKRRGHFGYDGPVRAVEPYVEPLAKTENRYVVKKDVEGEEYALRQVQSVLNKLTPEKFERLVTQLVDLIVGHLDHLEKIIELVFDKAVNEFAFANMYGDLCKLLHQRLVAQGTEVSRFREILLRRCQNEFTARAEEPIKISQLEDQEERDLAIFLSRRRARGLVTFIGHVYNRDLIGYNVIMQCLSGTAPVTSGESVRNIDWDIEDTCSMWQVVGKKFSAVKLECVQQVVNVSFVIFQKIIDARQVNSRMMFMLQDLVDLRSNRWEPRREVVVASKIAEVHKKAAAEALKKEKVAQRANEQRKIEERESRYYRRGPVVGRSAKYPSNEPKARAVASADGWHTTKRGSRNVPSDSSVHRAVDPLAQSGRPSRVAGELSDNKANANNFALLNDEHDEDDVVSAENALEDGGQCTSENSSENELELETSAFNEELCDFDEELFRSNIKGMVKEFSSNLNYEELVQSTNDLGHESMHHLIVYEAVAMAFEGKAAERENLPTLLGKIVEQSLLTSPQIIAGLAEYIEFLEDLEIDIPMVRTYLADLIAELIIMRALTMSYLQDIAGVKGVSIKTLQTIMGKDKEELLGLVKESKLDLSAILLPKGEGSSEDARSLLSSAGLNVLAQCL